MSENHCNALPTLDRSLRACGLPMSEARMLMEAASGLDRVRQITYPETVLDATSFAQFEALVARRRLGEPIAYLLGRREFYGLELAVGPGVLIPRPETELLVDLALERLPLGKQCLVLDLGTGSGAIPLAIASQRPDCTMTAVDVSPDALAIAERNGQCLGFAVRWCLSDWYDALQGEQFHLITSNPPYIAAGDWHLSEGDLRFEPIGALTDGADGLAHIRQIISEAGAHLYAEGWLLFEHGYDQAAACRQLLQSHGFTAVQSWQDLAGIERVTGGQLAATALR
ncbi:peptide chain release factor N(5)-glutamine methyltransferase [Parachitinimonas caeni]|uniref:Release factor glutamine methyltransferase n=1 Tax=Parachitinimonas caeni TaxID=3031301 RepID=A0ABT7DR60_9NEIS|nr:peptide chain release factor N(5)-glutamine methyltransferase [Parachitinimonas caeni]MDK2122555.1 peptide chain release factor N(5)-glutamine methyltransferase [Parachitinimonas caeni]